VLPPVVNVPASMTVPTDPGLSTATVEFTATVTSSVPGATIACVPASGSAFPLGVKTVTCTGRDVAGNSATNRFTITVYDNENPHVTVPANIVRPVDEGQTTAVVTYTATATDNSGSVSLVCVPPSGSAFAIGTTAVTCNAVDSAGNVGSGSFTVTITNSVVPPVDYGCVTASLPVLLCQPNHQMVPVSLWLTKGAPVKFSSVRIVSVTSNEPETGLWPDDLGNDWEITNTKTLKLNLRAERDDKGNGRIYTVVVEGKDKKGTLYQCSTTVTVPKNVPSKPKKGGKK